MAKNIEDMIIDIRERLNLVNQGVLDPESFSEEDKSEIEEIHSFVSSKDNFTPSEMSAITEALGQLRK
ncbi:DUF1128 family protein [Staphylococcus massiliensis]|uniref:UPF0435 protein C273_08521 n=1 Tax=Staphylococcus massiliensis S46 TaxID=1229783 RepID=K9AZ94_9STAP|nr:DUF1128 family protein [Staphylococcus massiliensis]EKU46830.1 hypothetical protein C273_08521 [Staphylococcus massiliensis S46]POA01569.1 DUF1128 domain-containing protein [Staphylococcus massiliensis CCUG 55927]